MRPLRNGEIVACAAGSILAAAMMLLAMYAHIVSSFAFARSLAIQSLLVLVSTGVSIAIAGYVATVHGWSRSWALAGLFNVIGILTVVGLGPPFIEALRSVRREMKALSSQHRRDTQLLAPGGASGEQTLKAIIDQINGAIAAYARGEAPSREAVTKSQVADHLADLAQNAQSDAGIVATALDAEGVRKFERSVSRLVVVARQMKGYYA